MEVLKEAIEDALVSAYKRTFNPLPGARAEMNSETGEIKIYARNTKAKSEKYIEEAPEIEVGMENMGRIAAQIAKQVITQRIREAEREVTFEKFSNRTGEIITGVVQQSNQKLTLVNLGRAEAILPKEEQIPGERYEQGARYKFYILDVHSSLKGPQIVVSRTHPGLLKGLFELEVPEIEEGIVEIKSLVREPGYRSKIAVYSNNKDVDPVGACVGARGSRVRMVVNELRNEKIDIARWSENLVEYMVSALSPAKVERINLIDEEKKIALIIVPDDQLSLAIGKEGQNVRLAARLTGWKIDIKGKSQFEEGEKLRIEKEGVQCEATTSSGKRCKNKALPSSKYCGIKSHQKLTEKVE